MMTGKLILVLLLSFLFSCKGEDEVVFILSEEKQDEIKQAVETTSDKDFINTVLFDQTGNVQPADYIAWVRNPRNGYQKEKEINEFKFSAQQKPALFMALIDAGTQNLNAESINKLVKEYEGLQYYEFRIEVEKSHGELFKYQVSGQIDYQDRVAYYAFNVKDDAILVYDDTDTIPCVISHFERTYDAGPYCVIQLAFNNENEKKYHDKLLIFNDRIFGNGLIKFRFNNKNFDNLLM